MTKLTSKERVRLAVQHKETDRVPVDWFARRDVTHKLREYLGLETLEDLYVHVGVDFRQILIQENDPEYQAKTNGVLGGNSQKSGVRYIMHDDGTYEDGWGVRWKLGSNQLYDEWISGPFADNDDLDSFKWPDVSIFESVESLKSRVAAHGDQYAIQGRLNLPFKVAWFMRGMENFLCDMMVDPEFATDLLERAAAYEIEKGKRLVEAGCDIIGIYGDIAMQDRMLVNPDAWRTLEKPIVARMIKIFREMNPDLIFFYHSDGDLSEVMPDLIEIGFNMINPIQPECMDVVEVKKKYGDKITMHGTISIQETLPNGTVEDVRKEVEDRIKYCGTNGGLVICPSNHVQNDTPLENLLEVYRAAGACPR